MSVNGQGDLDSEQPAGPDPDTQQANQPRPDQPASADPEEKGEESGNGDPRKVAASGLGQTQAEAAEPVPGAGDKPQWKRPSDDEFINIIKGNREGIPKRSGLEEFQSERLTSQREFQRRNNPYVDFGTAHIGQIVISAQQAAGSTTTAEAGAIGRAIEPLDKGFAVAIFVEPEGFAEACLTLQEQHCIVLCGSPHLGKRTAALYIGAYLFGDTHLLYELPPETNLRTASTLTDLEQSCVYLLDLQAGHQQLPGDEFRWRELGHSLSVRDSYLIVCMHETAHVGGEFVSWIFKSWQRPSNARKVIAKHVGYFYERDRLRGEPAYTKEQAIATLDFDVVAKLLERDLLPSRLGRAAEQICRYCASDYDSLNEAIGSLQEMTDKEVGEQFAMAKGDSERAFHIALAVFNNERLHIVEEAASLLEALLKPPSANGNEKVERVDEKPAVSSLFDDPTPLKLERANAELTRVKFPGLETHLEVVRLKNPAYQKAMLSYIWRNYVPVRSILLTWLGKFGGSTNPGIRLCTAAAIAYLARFEYLSVVHEVLVPWAEEDSYFYRRTLGFTCRAIVEQGDLTFDILKMLRAWAEVGPRRLDLVWAATRAYGEVGQLAPREAMARWHGIFTRYLYPENDHLTLSEHLDRISLLQSAWDTLANFFAAALALSTDRFVYVYAGILSGLRAWIEPEKAGFFATSVALPVFSALMTVRMSDGEEDRPSAIPSTEEKQPPSPPALLVLVAALHPEAVLNEPPYPVQLMTLETHPILMDLSWLLSAAIRTQEARTGVVQEELHDWLIFVEQDMKYYPTLLTVLRALLSERDFAHRHWQRELGRPLENWAYSRRRPLKVAARLVRDLGIQR